jgi:predicted dehydrogenase
MTGRLRIGVIGLRGRWQRYRRALQRFRGQVEVRAVCDEVLQRAERTARALSCAAALGPVDLFERSDVDAVLLLDAQWFGLWPLEYACKLGRPVLCATSLLADEPYADALHAQVQASGLPVLMDLPPLLTPAAEQLARLLAGPLGPPRLLHVTHSLTASCHFSERDSPLAAPPLLGLLAYCGRLFGEEPAGVQAVAGDGAAMAAVQLELSGGRAAQLSLWRGPRPAGRLVAVGSRGQVVAGLPRRLSWEEGGVRHALRLPRSPRELLLLERFLRCLREGRPQEPSFAEAYRALTWLRAARQSLQSRRPIPLAEGAAAP